jgi:hypothetical protein
MGRKFEMRIFEMTFKNGQRGIISKIKKNVQKVESSINL